MFKQMVVKTLCMGACKYDHKRATVIFQGPEDVLYDVIVNPETKPVVETSGHISEGTLITRCWVA